MREGDRRLIVNADDFGVDPAVNDAVERAFLGGILTSASLMVGAPATEDAVARAHRLKGLAVGLHIAVADGKPILPADRIPALVGKDGRFRDNLFRAGVTWFFGPGVRTQLAAEIAAQFEAFAATGLPLDHVNVHKHLHLHPTVGGLVIRIGERYGARAIRIPYEPRTVVLRAAPAGEAVPRSLPGFMMGPLRRRAAGAHLVVNDHVFGLAWSGAMTENRLLSLIPHLSPGLSELYLHPASADSKAMPHAVPEYLYREELQALVSPAVRAALESSAVTLTSFSAETQRSGPPEPVRPAAPA